MLRGIKSKKQNLDNLSTFKNPEHIASLVISKQDQKKQKTQQNKVNKIGQCK